MEGSEEVEEPVGVEEGWRGGADEEEKVEVEEGVRYRVRVRRLRARAPAGRKIYVEEESVSRGFEARNWIGRGPKREGRKGEEEEGGLRCSSSSSLLGYEPI